MARQDDRVFEALAKRYVEETGRLLNLEREEIEAANPPASLTLERKVREKIGPFRAGRSRRTRRIAATAAALAACLLLLVLAPGILDLYRQTDSDAAGSAEPAASDAPDGAAPQAPAEAAPDQAEESPAPGMIELELTLPSYFSVRDVELDDGKTIYYLDSERLDHVVLSVEQLDAPLDRDGMTARSVDGHPVWTRSEPEYHLLTFELGEITYVLTCRYELETLLDLAAYLL